LKSIGFHIYQYFYISIKFRVFRFIIYYQYGYTFGDVMKRMLVTGAGGPAGINFISSLRMTDEELYIVGSDINTWHLELPDVEVGKLH
jgi:hypothetical protein